MHMEDDEDPWAGLGVDEAEEIRSGTSTKAESQAEDVIDLNGEAERPDDVKQGRKARGGVECDADGR